MRHNRYRSLGVIGILALGSLVTLCHVDHAGANSIRKVVVTESNRLYSEVVCSDVTMITMLDHDNNLTRQRELPPAGSDTAPRIPWDIDKGFLYYDFCLTPPSAPLTSDILSKELIVDNVGSQSQRQHGKTDGDVQKVDQVNSSFARAVQAAKTAYDRRLWYDIAVENEDAIWLVSSVFDKTVVTNIAATSEVESHTYGKPITEEMRFISVSDGNAILTESGHVYQFSGKTVHPLDSKAVKQAIKKAGDSYQLLAIDDEANDRILYVLVEKDRLAAWTIAFNAEDQIGLRTVTLKEEMQQRLRALVEGTQQMIKERTEGENAKNTNGKPHP